MANADRTPDRRIVKSNCHNCGYLCGLLATVEATADGDRLVGLQPDPSRYPYSQQVARGCSRWRMNLQHIDAPDRINYPLKRIGRRGSGEWQRVGWDEALDEIAARLGQAAAEYGPRTLASAIGGPHASYWPLHRFLNLFGTPNNMGIGQICWNTRIWVEALAYGWPIEPQVSPGLSAAVFLWGTNPADSDNLLFWRSLRDLAQAGTPLVVIDPRRTRTARLATLHLAPRPGSDGFLALAMIRQIIASGRHDAGFVQRWCSGFDELRTHVQPYTLAAAEQATGVPAADIARAAELFSGPGPTALLSGRGIDQLGPNTAPTHRALASLRAITGDVDRPGASLIAGMSDFTPEIDLEKSAWLTPEARAQQLNLGVSALQCYPGYEGASRLTERQGKRLPMRYLTSAHPHLVWQAALTGRPYRVSALVCMAANPLVTYADTHLVHAALQALDLLVVLEYYMTPTAQLADFLLPSAGALERPLLQAQGGVANFCYGGAAALAPYYERRADYDVFRELGLRLGQAEHWPEASLDEALRAALAPAGLNWQDWTDQGIYQGPAEFYKHEQLLADGSPRGFATTTGKIELASEYLEALGGGRLPVPLEVRSGAVPLAAGAGAAGAGAAGVGAGAGAAGVGAGAAGAVGAAGAGPAAGPAGQTSPAAGANAPSADPALAYTLITGARRQPYWASSFFNNPEFRRRRPDPTVQISAATAAQAGLADGQWARLRTRRGTACFKVQVAELVDGVLSAEYGWWYPEEAPGEPHLSGLWRSNVNILTEADPAGCEPLIGSWTYNGIPCTIQALDTGSD